MRSVYADGRKPLVKICCGRYHIEWRMRGILRDEYYLDFMQPQFKSAKYFMVNILFNVVQSSRRTFVDIILFVALSIPFYKHHQFKIVTISVICYHLLFAKYMNYTRSHRHDINISALFNGFANSFAITWQHISQPNKLKPRIFFSSSSRKKKIKCFCLWLRVPSVEIYIYIYIPVQQNNGLRKKKMLGIIYGSFETHGTSQNF